MSAYLYTWNPKRWNWNDLQEGISYVNKDERYDTRWSCGNTKRITIGDFFFLMRLGVEPKGIIGCGYVSSIPCEGPHWGQGQNSEGKMALYTDLLFTILSEYPIIDLGQLRHEHPGCNWTPQSSGTSIPENVASQLMSIIQIDKPLYSAREYEREIITYIEGKPRRLTYTTYNRSLPARQACIAYYGYDCSVCGFDFEEAFGDLGKYYIEVHHLNPMSDIGEEYVIEPIRDLRPVCANCHVMLHREKRVLSIEELRARRR